ncbi:MAG: ATP-binding cassette domain-containing protein [Halofilum sp. (in: g-proteobacteria)]|nr:ATP-binding cassette domain-containing protein [Halofilum sp. (in: g-proteobacteria)]
MRRQEQCNEGRAREILKLIKLDHQVDTYAGDLSGGQKKLLMLGQSLMLAPKLILLDEPVAGVHPDLINDITDTIRHLQSERQDFLIIERNMGRIR